jgi:uncharacterized protein YuzE
MMDVKFDPDADAAYIELAEWHGRRQGREVGPGVIVDFDEAGEVVGIEVLGVRRRRIPVGQVQVEVLNGPKSPEPLADEQRLAQLLDGTAQAS